MQINLAKSAGFCFGVKRALKIALDTAKLDKSVCMLGDIVHNEEVVKLITKSGIRKVKRLGRGKGKTLIIRAHGTCKKTLLKAKKLGYKVIDATCPMVKETHKIAKSAEKKGFRVIIIGDKNHDEVHGIAGQLGKKAIIIDGSEDTLLDNIAKIEKACVVVQSTQNLDKVEETMKIIRSKVKNVKFYNTICRPTTIKQDEIKKMPLDNEMMIIIGSRNSANTKRLFEISKRLNKKSYWIDSKNEIKKGWFKNVRSVGITAGASTPEPVIKAIINHIRNYKYLSR
ncbi:MAG: 4-hydroxy-3-methylbut-2-enyl diphosphate reductase [Candidatus Omnitrophica bacterium]|nr:4-hydroxy-3-methylbut-2-enyl diphosphate reductase [Candidatus Omnitrophota bacterium]